MYSTIVLVCKRCGITSEKAVVSSRYLECKRCYDLGVRERIEEKKKTPEAIAVRKHSCKMVGSHKRGSLGRYSLSEWNELLDLCGHICVFCGIHESQSPMTSDHIIPISKGGNKPHIKHPARLS